VIREINMKNIPFSSLYSRGKYIISHEGWPSILRQIFLSTRDFFYSGGSYYLHEFDLPIQEDLSCQPKIECTAKVISNLGELDELIAQGYELKVYDFHRKIARGAIAFCILVEKKLASVTWVALNKEAKELIDVVPYKVNFDKGEACAGGTFTDPAYRGKGLMPYTNLIIFSYLADKQIVKLKASVNFKNMASLKSTSKLKPRVHYKGSYVKILWWHSWKEEPIKEDAR